MQVDSEMVDRKTRILVFAVFATAFAVAVTIALYIERMEQQFCLGVSLIKEAQLAQYTEDLQIDINKITFCGKPVAADLKSSTIYISQPESTGKHYSALLGQLTPPPEILTEHALRSG